jgi:hypothetical protein
MDEEHVIHGRLQSLRTRHARVVLRTDAARERTEPGIHIIRRLSSFKAALFSLGNGCD